MGILTYFNSNTLHPKKDLLDLITDGNIESSESVVRVLSITNITRLKSNLKYLTLNHMMSVEVIPCNVTDAIFRKEQNSP